MSSSALAALAPREGERPNLRERALRHGVECLGDIELLAILVGRGVAGERLEERVARLWHDAGGLAGLAHRGVGGLSHELGLGLALGARVAAGLELGMRLSRNDAAVAGEPAASSRDVEQWANLRLSHLPHEELWALLIDGRNTLIAERMLAKGGAHAVALHARDVLRPIVREGCSAFVLVHNHPGGDPTPSPEDVRFTHRVAAAADLLGIALVDHVVVAARRGPLHDARGPSRTGVSMLDAGLFGKERIEG